MNIADRFKANAIIEEITSSKDEFFNAERARELIGLIPVQRVPFFTFEFNSVSHLKGSEGYSPGVGNIPFDGEANRKHVAWNGIKVERIGGYKLEHTPGELEISLMWVDSVENKTGYKCRLNYNEASKEPTQLKLFSQKEFIIPIPFTSNFTLRFGSFVPWKIPSDRRP
jgi:hypothetical protein